MVMNFLADFEKKVNKIEGVAGSAQPPLYWYSFGNYVLNKIMSGSFFKGVPQGRLTALSGPSGVGKSFILGNIVLDAQRNGDYVLLLDSENALSNDFMRLIGVNTDENYNYKSVMTISHVTEVVSAFIKGYEAEYGKYNPNAPRVLIGIDSLDMLLTDSEADNFEKGIQKGDQGQKSKQLKAMLKSFVNYIKPFNITMVVTSQVYQNQDIRNGEGVWIINNAIRFALSQIVLLTKLKLKDNNDASNVLGINMKCEGYKTRFTKPFQKVTIEVPYDTGMNPYSGLDDVLVNSGLVKKSGGWFTITETGEKFQFKNIEQYAKPLMDALEKTDVYLDVSEHTTLEEDMEDVETLEDLTERKAKKVTSKKK